jgi:hypothetical protein
VSLYYFLSLRYLTSINESQRILSHTHTRPLCHSEQSMKVDLRRPSNSVILHIGNASTPPIFPLPPSGAEAKQFFTLLTFLPSYRLMSNVGKATQTPRTHDCTLVFGVSGALKVVNFPSSTSGYRISWTRFGTTFSDSETKRVELQGPNVSGALLVSPFFPFCQLPQGSGFLSSLSTTPSGCRLPKRSHHRRWLEVIC